MLPRIRVPSRLSNLASLAVVVALAGCGRDATLLAPGDAASPGLVPDPQGVSAAASGLESQSRSSSLSPQVSASAIEIHGPTVIIEPGAYRVVQDFSVSAETGDGIVIRSDDVQLSLEGYAIAGPGNKAGRGIVVDGAKNVDITGGTLRTFGVGLALLGTSQSTVRGVTVEGGDEMAAPPANPPQIGLLLVNSWQNAVTENRLSLVNLGIFVRGGGSFENRILNNTVTAGSNGLLGICYNPASGEGPVGPTRDKVTHNVLDGFGGGIQTSTGSTENRFVANVIRFLNVAWDDRNGTNVFLGNKTEDLTP